MKPFVKYPGGKIKEFPLVDKFKPNIIERYFEPFVGGGAIYLNLNIKESYINDKSTDLTNLYKFIKYQDEQFFSYLDEFDFIWRQVENSETISSEVLSFDKFAQYFTSSFGTKMKKLSSLEENGYTISDNDKVSMKLTAKKTAIYMCIRDIYNDFNGDESLHTACFYFLREYCYSSMFRFSKEGKFNVPYGGRSYDKKYMTSKIEQMKSKAMFDCLKATCIFNLDFEEFLNRFDLTSNDFLFLDPPYDSDFSTYDKNVFDKQEQRRLAKFLSNTAAKWMIIIKKTAFIYGLYKDFNIYEYDKNYLVSFKNRNIKEAKHLLITNYKLEE